MKAVFVHDHIFYTDSRGNYYSSGKLPYEVWGRYLSTFDSLTVAARVERLSLSDDIEKLNLASGDKVSFMPIPSLSNPVTMVTKRPKAAKKMKTVLADADAVIARVPSELGALAVRVAKQMNKPYAVEVVAHAWDALWNYGSIAGKIYAPILTYRTQLQVKNAPYAIYVTREFLQRKYPSKGVVSNASNVELLYTSEDVLKERVKKINENDNSVPFRIGLIGSLSSKYKGIDTALEAFSQIYRYLPPNFEFHILGDGDIAYWKKMANQMNLEKHIFFDGTLPGGESAYSWLDELDLYIHPSRQEGLPRAVIEAMSRGCPIIASTVAGIPELLDKNSMHKPGETDKLAELLKKNIKDKNWQIEQAERNFKVAGDYTKAKLDQKRSEFWNSFGKYVEEKG